MYKQSIRYLYNSLEYSKNYSVTSGSLWNYYRDKVDNDTGDILNTKSIGYEKNITENTLERPPQPGQEGDVDPLPQPPVLEKLDARI